MPVALETEIDQGDLAQIADAFAGIDPAITEAERDVAKTIRNLVLERTPVGIRKKTEGAVRMKQSWSEPIKQSGGGIAFGSDLPYAARLETGTYPGVGGRTVAEGSGIYSRQAPGGMVQPVLDDSEITNTIVNDVIERIRQGVSLV